MPSSATCWTRASAEDLVAAVPVLAAKLSNDGGISWSQTMEICRFGFTRSNAVEVHETNNQAHA